MHLMDYIFENFLDDMKKVKTYVCTDSQIFYGLDESAITIISPESLISFRNVIAKDKRCQVLLINCKQLCSQFVNRT